MTKQKLAGVVLDWAGTTIDHGCLAPAAVFQKIFSQRQVPVTVAQARGPMGMAKREHIQAVAALPDVARRWQETHGHAVSESDIDAMYADFLPMQKAILADYAQMIPGVTEAIEHLRSLGLKIGSSTGYTQELMQIVSPAAAQQGYTPDFVLCAEDAPRGRPAPYLLFLAAMKMDIYPMSQIVKVDDTVVGIEAGRNAGCWTIGITRTGNEVGYSEDEWNQLDSFRQSEHLQKAEEKLLQAGADYCLESVAELPSILPELQRRLDAGERPTVGF